MGKYKISNEVSEDERICAPDGHIITNRAQIEFINLMEDYHSGDPQRTSYALEMMCENMRGYIRTKVAKQFSTYINEIDDLLQEGMMGFISELRKDRYDPYRTAPTTYFDKSIGHAIRDFITRQVTKTTSYYHSTSKKINEAVQYLEDCGADVDDISIANITGLPLATIHQCMFYKQNTNMASLEAPAPIAGDGQPQTLKDIIQDPVNNNPEGIFFEQERDRILYEAISQIDDRDKEIVLMYFGLDCEKVDIKSIAKNMKCSVDEVRETLNRSYRKLANNKELAGIYGRKPGFDPKQPFEIAEIPDMSVYDDVFSEDTDQLVFV